jgi:hypothetical protein
MDEDRQGTAPEVPETAKQGAETQRHEVPDLSWAEAGIWTEHMVLALGNGVKEGVRCSCSNGFFADAGLFALHTAQQGARRSR